MWSNSIQFFNPFGEILKNAEREAARERFRRQTPVLKKSTVFSRLKYHLRQIFTF